MLDRFVLRPPSQPDSIRVNQTITTHEHRAPTEDSVRLLREFEDRAEKSLLGRVKLDGMKGSGEVVAFRDHLHACVRLIFRAKIGDHSIVAEHVVREYDMESPKDIINGLKQAAATKIAESLLSGVNIGVLFSINGPFHASHGVGTK